MFNACSFETASVPLCSIILDRAVSPLTLAPQVVSGWEWWRDWCHFVLLQLQIFLFCELWHVFWDWVWHHFFFVSQPELSLKPMPLTVCGHSIIPIFSLNFWLDLTSYWSTIIPADELFLYYLLHHLSGDNKGSVNQAIIAEDHHTCHDI